MTLLDQNGIALPICPKGNPHDGVETALQASCTESLHFPGNVILLIVFYNQCTGTHLWLWHTSLFQIQVQIMHQANQSRWYILPKIILNIECLAHTVHQWLWRRGDELPKFSGSHQRDGWLPPFSPHQTFTTLPDFCLLSPPSR